MSTTSIRSRFTATVLSNIVRAGLSFLTGIVVARGLGPERYGDFSFLLGSFAAMKMLLDMGAGSAFYTFMCQKARGSRFVAHYIAWQAVQAVVMVLAIVVIPGGWLSEFWIGQERYLVLLAFLATFLQQQAWQTMSQIGESKRLSQRVQYLNLGIAVAYLILVLVAWHWNAISVRLLFTVIVVEYVVALALGCRYLWVPAAVEDGHASTKEIIRGYWAYCRPLILYSWLSFLYAFADTWLLRKFGGAEQQAFFSIASQFSTVGLLATTAMLQVFWKEVAEAYVNGEHQRIAVLYQKVSQSLFMFAAIVSGFLIPWSPEIARVVLGPQYVGGAAVLAIMFLYPIHQSMGQIVGTTFYAIGKTTPQVVIGMASMAVSIPITYFVQAPADALLPGLELGAAGMAWKMVVMQVIPVNIMAWWIARFSQWKYEWRYQLVGIGGAVFLGWLAFEIASFFPGTNDVERVSAFIASGVIYSVGIGGFLWSMPWLAGWSRREIKEHLAGVLALRRG